MPDDSDTPDVPLQAQHSQPDDAKVAGVLQQQEADLAGHDQASVLSALRQRFADTGVHISEESLQEHARRIAGLKTNKYSDE